MPLLPDRKNAGRRSALVTWLLAGDPAIAWQTERDLLHLPATRYARTRARVVREGWAAALLGRGAKDGTWGGGLYTPKWTSTFYTLQLLALLGVDRGERACASSCAMLLERGVQADGGVRLWVRAPADTCVTGMMVATAVAFGFADDARTRRMVRWLLGQQMGDGGWNCRFGPGRPGATHGSFHTTTSVLEGLHAWTAETAPGDARTSRAAAAGREFLLKHRLYRSHRTQAIARDEFTRFVFPHWWKFDVLRGLDLFRAADAWDERLADPLALLERRRGADGRWALGRPHPGRVWLALEKPRAPSRWNTLRALRVLEWAARATRSVASP